MKKAKSGLKGLIIFLICMIEAVSYTHLTLPTIA